MQSINEKSIYFSKLFAIYSKLLATYLESFTTHPGFSLFSLASISTFPSKPKSDQVNFWIYNGNELSFRV